MRWMIVALALLAGCAQTTTVATSQEAPGQGSVAVLGGHSLNAYRTASGLRPLALSPRLQAAAEIHARDMAAMAKMTHTGSDGSEVADRVKRQGFRYRRVAENIAETGRGLDRAMELWTASAPHRKNMLLRDVTHYGIAQSGDYWAMVVARPR
ncbi:CAP domain-containing protein [Salipiger sp. P9]|uniref:CAP domain-containing protein n=1 Tax=Salipiger pentaromativorans TaxID=2943193 RepID=UPI002157C583|nr:CAP domain-containing protein [Salipiger pentaromativorans]MCR8546533.1 CAP domain-containing protein [Salipiger pentaromativorans]